jgi:hypothetical protein
MERRFNMASLSTVTDESFVLPALSARRISSQTDRVVAGIYI